MQRNVRRNTRSRRLKESIDSSKYLPKTFTIRATDVIGDYLEEDSEGNWEYDFTSEFSYEINDSITVDSLDDTAKIKAFIMKVANREFQDTSYLDVIDNRLITSYDCDKDGDYVDHSDHLAIELNIIFDINGIDMEETDLRTFLGL